MNSNKTQLFRFLSDSLYQTLDLKGKQLVVTQEEPVFSKPLLQENASLSPCSHEEGDSRMLLHANHAACRGHQKILMRSVDTDVVALAVYVAQVLGP